MEFIWTQTCPKYINQSRKYSLVTKRNFLLSDRRCRREGIIPNNLKERNDSHIDPYEIQASAEALNAVYRTRSNTFNDMKQFLYSERSSRRKAVFRSIVVGVPSSNMPLSQTNYNSSDIFDRFRSISFTEWKDFLLSQRSNRRSAVVSETQRKYKHVFKRLFSWFFHK